MNHQLIENNQIVKLTFEFALDIIQYCEGLESKRKFVVANQLLKAGTSIGANVWEAQNSESRNDFIHKLKIAAKEAEETGFWLLICNHSNNYPDCEELIGKLESISKMLSKIIFTAKSRQSTSKLAHHHIGTSAY
jgi:four helix bundle protein